MAAGRVPGPLRGEFISGVHTPPSTRGGVPGPLGRQYAFYADKDGSGGQTSTAKPTALIIIGAGQEELQQKRSNKLLDEAARLAFDPYVKDHDVTIKHVTSAREMKALIAGGAWDVVVYFGHGITNRQELNPGHADTLSKNPDILTRDELAKSLQQAKTEKVYLLGCMSAATGLANNLSKDLPGTSVFGTVDLLLAKWYVGNDPTKGKVNELTFSEKPTQYISGFAMEVGEKGKLVKAKRRPQQLGEPVDPNGFSQDGNPTVEQ